MAKQYLFGKKIVKAKKKNDLQLKILKLPENHVKTQL